MGNFIKTIVPTEGYQEIKKIGERYVVHLEGVAEGEITTCYECMTDSEPNIEELTQELQEYKAYRQARDLKTAKTIKINSLLYYDNSRAVNSFAIYKDGVKLTDYWIDRDLRTSIEKDVRTFANFQDHFDFDVREIGITLRLNCEKFLTALESLNVYAVTAFNVTSRHMAAINSLATKEEVEEYDFTVGYPNKLTFHAEDLID